MIIHTETVTDDCPGVGTLGTGTHLAPTAGDEHFACKRGRARHGEALAGACRVSVLPADIGPRRCRATVTSLMQESTVSNHGGGHDRSQPPSR